MALEVCFTELVGGIGQPLKDWEINRGYPRSQFQFHTIIFENDVEGLEYMISAPDQMCIIDMSHRFLND